ncbi:head-tail connector protein [Jeotgalicoccus halotolerans]|uniref:head-tail connector protein n=1 Tax=Jeotgalicoccus halotolerans TaxID=157227 RepID=UPI00351150C6
MTSVTVEDLKEYLYVDGDHQNTTIESLIKGAESELALSGVKRFKEEDEAYPLYKLAVQILVARHFEDRASTEKTNVNLDYIVSKLAIASGGDPNERLQQVKE